MSQAIQYLSVTIPFEVAEFAATQRVTDILPAVIHMTQRLFPGAPLSVVVEDDPEIANDRHIVLIVRAAIDDETLETRWSWHRGLFACCPAPLACTFRLGLESEQ